MPGTDAASSSSLAPTRQGFTFKTLVTASGFPVPAAPNPTKAEATKRGRYWFGNARRKTNETLRRCCRTPSSRKRRLTAEFQVNDRAACVSQASQTAGNVTADTRHLDSSPTPLQVMRMSSLEPCFVYFFSFLNSTFGKVAHAKKGLRKGEDGSAQLCTGEVMKRPRGGGYRCGRSMDNY